MRSYRAVRDARVRLLHPGSHCICSIDASMSLTAIVTFSMPRRHPWRTCDKSAGDNSPDHLCEQADLERGLGDTREPGMVRRPRFLVEITTKAIRNVVVGESFLGDRIVPIVETTGDRLELPEELKFVVAISRLSAPGLGAAPTSLFDSRPAYGLCQNSGPQHGRDLSRVPNRYAALTSLISSRQRDMKRLRRSSDYIEPSFRK